MLSYTTLSNNPERWSLFLVCLKPCTLSIDLLKTLAGELPVETFRLTIPKMTTSSDNYK